VTDNLPATRNKQKDEEIENKFIELLSTFRDPREAALKAGYSKTYSYNIRSNKFKNQRFIEKLKQTYNGDASVLLLPILGIESALIHEAYKLLQDAQNEQDPTQRSTKFKEAADFCTKTKGTRKEIKQSVGVLQADDAPKPMMINVKAVQNILKVIQNNDSQPDTLIEEI